MKGKLDLRSKILFGSLLLVIPLAVALTYVYQFGSAQIEAAQREALGVTSTAPLWDAIFAWQAGDGAKTTGGLEEFAKALAAEARVLVPAVDATTGATWSAADNLKTLVQAAGGDPAQFSAVHKGLMNDILVLSDNSGLVLDPELESYYLVLAAYQTVPNMLEKLTDLRPLLSGQTTRLGDQDRLLLYSRARELQFQAQYLGDQVSRSTKAAVAGGEGSIPGFAASMQGLMKSIRDASSAIEQMAGVAVLGGVFDPASLKSQVSPLVAELKEFQTDGTKVLGVMLDRRIANLGAHLVTAFVWAGVGLVFGGTLLLFVVSGIRRRVFGLVGSLGTLAQHDLTRAVPSRLLASGDELGRLAGSVHTLQTDLKTQVLGIDAVLKDLSEIGSHLGTTAAESSSAIEQMSAISTSVARAAGSQSEQTVHANQIVSQMVERIGESNELTQGMATQFFLFSQSMEANRNRIRETAAEAVTTGKLAEDLDQMGDQGERSLGNLKKSIQGVVQKTGEIHEIVQFILDIADRTNLLSMNAAIEAAHAGSAGRGFSIVADEIRKLAEVSSKQAQTIKGLLEAITGVVDRTLNDSEATARSFQSLRKDITSVRHASQDIAQKMAAQDAEDATLSEGLQKFALFYGQLSEALELQIEESQTVKQVLESLENSGREINASMQEQKLGMEQSSGASAQVRETALNLGQVIGVLEAQVSRFKT